MDPDFVVSRAAILGTDRMHLPLRADDSFGQWDFCIYILMLRRASVDLVAHLWQKAIRRPVRDRKLAHVALVDEEKR